MIENIHKATNLICLLGLLPDIPSAGNFMGMSQIRGSLFWLLPHSFAHLQWPSYPVAAPLPVPIFPGCNQGFLSWQVLKRMISQSLILKNRKI